MTAGGRAGRFRAMVTPRRTALSAFLSATFVLGLSIAGGGGPSALPAAAADSSTPLPVPPGLHTPAVSYDYYYAAAATQQLDQGLAKGASATLVVEAPKQVRKGHSLAEIAVESPAMDYSYIEAGWIVNPHQRPQLFIFWWDQGVPKCYNQGCGYVADGPGLQPGATLEKHATLSLTWQHKAHKWVLMVNDRRSGYYPDDQWTGDFERTGFAQVFGEVAVKDGDPVCTDMGDGKVGTDPKAATINDVAFIAGPAVTLQYDLDDPAHNYLLDIRSDTAMGYGGPGVC